MEGEGESAGNQHFLCFQNSFLYIPNDESQNWSQNWNVLYEFNGFM